MGHPFFALQRPIVFGHRGASGERPENTLAAFEHALAEGADVLETDVHLSHDGEIMVFHDADLDRTTNASGPLARHGLASLRRLDAGYRFSPDHGRSFPYRDQGVRIPTLREVFEALPGARFNVELKCSEPRLVEGVLRLVAEFERAHLTLLAAEAEETMCAVHACRERLGIDTALGASVADVLGFVQAALGAGSPPAAPMALQIPASFAGRPLATPELIAFAHQHRVQVHVWTINDPREMQRLLSLGVDGLMSDFPGRLRQVVGQRSGGPTT